MTVNTPWMFISGSAIIGFLLPEIFALSPNIKNVPWGMNLLSSMAAGLVAASFC